MVTRLVISSEHRIEVPSTIREELRLDAGDHLLAHVRDGVLVLVPEGRNPVERLRGLYREIWEGIDAHEYVNQERDSWEAS